MSQARIDFRSRISSARSAVDLFNLRDVAATSIGNRVHNASARIIRNGLAVQCFNIFEDFVRARISEIFRALDNSGVPFNCLPLKFQTATTVEAIKAILYQIKFQEPSNKVLYAQQYSGKVASTIGSNLELAEIAFFHSGSNISDDNIRTALAAFSIEEPWIQMTSFASRISLMAMPAKTVFKELATRRHLAAHDPAAMTSEVDLTQSLDNATALAVAFDVLLGHAAGKIAGTRSAISSFILTDQVNIPLRFIRYDSTRSLYYERNAVAARNIRVSHDRESLYPDARSRSERENGALLIYDNHGSFVDWWV